jgi:hypothetical protein
MILIVSSLLDSHARVVARVLERRHVPVFIGDVIEFGGGAQLSQHNGETRWIRADGSAADLGETRAVWCRRNFAPVFDAALRDPCDRDFVRRQWSEFLWGIVCAMPVPLVNDPFRQQAATKPLQLSLARSLGLRVPDTLISNDADAVLAFVDRHDGRVIHKTLVAAVDRLLFTKRWDARDADAIDALDLAPTIFQEQVGGHREVRLTIVGERFFAAEFEVGGDVDGRLDVDVAFRPHTLPLALQDQLVRLMDALGLCYATVDLRIDEDGEYVFLELNPQGQFLYAEIKTGMPISEAMADLLCGGQAASLRSAAREGHTVDSVPFAREPAAA